MAHPQPIARGIAALIAVPPFDHGYVYALANAVTGWRYIGQTRDKPSYRFTGHKVMLRKGTHHCRALQAAWDAYGEAAFTFELIAGPIDSRQLFGQERLWIARYSGAGVYNRRAA